MKIIESRRPQQLKPIGVFTKDAWAYRDKKELYICIQSVKSLAQQELL